MLRGPCRFQRVAVMQQKLIFNISRLCIKGFGDSPGDQFRVLTVHVGNHDEVLAAAVLGEDVAETKGILGDGF